MTAGSDLVLQRAASEHGFAHIRILDVSLLLQPTRLHHWAVSLVINAFSRLVVGEVFDQRCAQRLERFASCFQVLRLRQRFGLLGDIRGEHLHLVAFTAFAMALACSSTPLSESFASSV